jgi:tetratricopeptide (TPR) repeat protein
MRRWLKNIAVIVSGFGQAGLMILAEDVLPGLRLYSAAEYLAANCYSQTRRPDHRELALARIYERAGKIDQAEQSLQRAVAMRSSIPDNYLYLGQFFARQNRPLDAIRAFEQAIILAHDRPSDLEYATRRIEELRRPT